MTRRITHPSRAMSLRKGGGQASRTRARVASKSGNAGRRNASANPEKRVILGRELEFIASCIRNPCLCAAIAAFCHFGVFEKRQNDDGFLCSYAGTFPPTPIVDHYQSRDNAHSGQLLRTCYLGLSEKSTVQGKGGRVNPEYVVFGIVYEKNILIFTIRFQYSNADSSFRQAHYILIALDWVEMLIKFTKRDFLYMDAPSCQNRKHDDRVV